MKSDNRPRILMVDDDRDFHAIVRTWLSPRYDVSSVACGEGLIEELEQATPDLLILDIMMPGPSGTKLCDRIRSHPRFAGLPILFLTGCRDDEHFMENLRAGGTAFLTKPLERKKLLSLVKELVNSQEIA